MNNPVAAARPNILLIICDQLRYDCVGSSGARPVSTPHMDSIARGGVRFTNAFTPQPLCCPARQSLLTSRRPERDGFLWNHDIALKTLSMAPGERLWPRRLSEAGYRMAYVGKWHESERHSPLEFGYDIYDSDDDYRAFREGAYGAAKFERGIEGEIDPVPLEGAHTHWLARRACARLEELAGANASTGTNAGTGANAGAGANTGSAGGAAADSCAGAGAATNASAAMGASATCGGAAGGAPWHLRVDFTEPHPPVRPSVEFARMYDADDIPPWDGFYDDFADKPYIQKQMVYTWGLENYDWKRWSSVVARYYATVSQLDDAVGKILDTLERSGCAGNTLVVLTPDHGDMCGAHRMIDKHNVMYDDIVHVPLLMRWPDRLPAGMAADAFVQNTLDIGPTLLEAAGLAAGGENPDGLICDGRSLFPLFGGGAPADWRDCAVSTYNGQQFGLYTQRMIRDREWKYVWNTADTDELYNLREDPGELKNRVRDARCAETLKSMRRRLHDVLVREGDGLLKHYWLRDQLLGVTKKL